MSIIEKLARGKYTDRPTLISATYAFEVWEYLVEKECVLESGKLDIDRFRNKLQNEVIDIKVLNQVLASSPTYEVPLKSRELQGL